MRDKARPWTWPKYRQPFLAFLRESRLKKSVLACFLGFFLLAFLSCTQNSLDPTPISVIKACPDSRMVGNWVCSEFGAYLSSIHEFTWHYYSSIDFTNNNKYWEYVNREEYGVQQYEYPMTFDYEWKVEGSSYSHRLWDNQYSDWDSMGLVYVNSTNIKIGSHDYFKKK